MPVDFNFSYHVFRVVRYDRAMWHVYLLLCKDKSVYTGITNNLKKRFGAHEAGVGARYTRSHRPVKIVYSESYRFRGQALKREAEIKSWPRIRKLALIK